MSVHTVTTAITTVAAACTRYTLHQVQVLFSQTMLRASPCVPLPFSVCLQSIRSLYLLMPHVPLIVDVMTPPR